MAYNFEQVLSSANSGKGFAVDCLNAHAYMEQARPQSLVWSKKHMKKNTYIYIYIHIYIYIYIYVYIYIYMFEKMVVASAVERWAQSWSEGSCLF